MGIDKKVLEQNRVNVKNKIEMISNEVNEIIGEKLELKKNAKIATILYEKLALTKPIQKTTKKGKKGFIFLLLIFF